MQRPRSAVMPGVQGRKEFAQFRPATLAEHESIGPHPQGFAHQAFEPDPADPLEIGLPCLERDEVRMLDPQLVRLLDRDDPLALIGARKDG